MVTRLIEQDAAADSVNLILVLRRWCGSSMDSLSDTDEPEALLSHTQLYHISIVSHLFWSFCIFRCVFCRLVVCCLFFLSLFVCCHVIMVIFVS